MVDNLHVFLKVLNELSITQPTEIQNLCFHPLYEGKSVFGLAPTGSGKTLAFVLPLLLKVNEKNRIIQQIILVPTRELGSQIARVCQRVSDVILKLDQKNILVRTAFGGIPISKQIKELDKNPHVLIATPGRLLDLMKRKCLDPKKINALVLDEADVLVSMGFDEQVHEIYEYLPKNIQIALFSATKNDKVTSLEEVLLQNKDPLVCNAKILLEDKEGEKLHDSEIQHQYILTNSDSKFSNLVSYLKNFDKHNSGKIIVFCHQRETAQKLAADLKNEGFSADALTGDLGQVHRMSITRNFKSGNLKVLVATNIASRGIDIDKLSAVLHFEVPSISEDYIHRSGRTGRSGFSQGVSITLCDPRNKNNYLKLMEDLNLNTSEIKVTDFKNSSKNNSLNLSEVKKIDTDKVTNHKKISYIKIHLNKGKQNKIRPGDIVGALIQELNLTKEDIGNIFIFTNFTHVDVNASKKNLILNMNFKVKNMMVRALIAN